MSNEGVIDAKFATIEITKPLMFTRREHDMWILNHLLKPITPGSLFDDIKIVSLSSDLQFTTGPIDSQSPSYRLTPSTRISTFGTRYRIVFLIDFSSSMSSVNGNGQPRVHLNVAFETYCFKLILV